VKILITGAFGNIGLNTLNLLLKRDYQVSTFDLKTKRNVKTAKKYENQLINCFWGDICNYDDITRAIGENDVIIHLAAIIPPLSEKKPDLAYKINVEGTRNIIEAIKEINRGAKFIFSSSVSVHGDRQELKPPVKFDCELKPSDNYSNHKIQCEKIIRNSDLDWTILRLGAVPAVDFSQGFDPIMFDVDLNSRIEFVHSEDVALALSNAAEKIYSNDEEVVYKTFMIGGGEAQGCQMYYRDFLGDLLDAFGIGNLPDGAFGKEPFYTDWMETEKSQKILHYQSRSFKYFVRKIKSMWGIRRWFVKMFFLFSRSYLLRRSPYWKNKWKLY
jgi:nucleoside-diphosphate-sugar epimerase